MLRIAFAQQNCEFRQFRVKIYYIILSSLHPQYDGQKAIDTHRYKLLQLVLIGDATPLYSENIYLNMVNQCTTDTSNLFINFSEECPL